MEEKDIALLDATYYHLIDINTFHLAPWNEPPNNRDRGWQRDFVDRAFEIGFRLKSLQNEEAPARNLLTEQKRFPRGVYALQDAGKNRQIYRPTLISRRTLIFNGEKSQKDGKKPRIRRSGLWRASNLLRSVKVET